MPSSPPPGTGFSGHPAHEGAPVRAPTSNSHAHWGDHISASSGPLCLLSPDAHPWGEGLQDSVAGGREGESGGESVDSPALEGVFENIQSNGLTVQMKQMSHRDRPLAKVIETWTSPDSYCWTAGQKGEDGTPALPPGPSLVPPAPPSDDGDEATPQASRKPKA